MKANRRIAAQASALFVNVDGLWYTLTSDKLREFAGRHNDRNQDTVEQMRRTARRMLGKRLKYADLTS